MGYGIKGFAGIGKETTWGTAVAATDYLKTLNENVALALDRFDIVNVHASLAEPDDATGINRIEGSIEFPGFPTGLGYFLKSAFVQSSVVEVTSGVLWTTKFYSPTADFATGVAAGQPYTLELFRDVSSSHRYAGAMVNQLTFGFAPNQDVRISAGIIAKAATLLSKTTASFPGSPVKPFTFDTASIQLGGAANARFEALQIEVDNQLEGIPALNASTAVAKILRRGPQMVNISGTLDFPDVAEYQQFVNQTEQSLVVHAFKANSFALLIDIPRMVFTAFPTGVPGRERLTADFEAKGFFHSGSANAIEVQLTTTKSDY